MVIDNIEYDFNRSAFEVHDFLFKLSEIIPQAKLIFGQGLGLTDTVFPRIASSETIIF